MHKPQSRSIRPHRNGEWRDVHHGCGQNAANPPHGTLGWLHSNRWIYRRPGNAGWLAYQDKLQSQVLQHKVVTIAHSDGSERVTEQVRVTAKGLTRLSEHFSLH